MGMTADILEKRRKYLGASECATVLGFGKYSGQTPDAVYWSKVAPPVERDAEHLQMGSDFEPALAQFAQRKLGVTFLTDPDQCFKVMPEGIGAGILSATPDGILLNTAKRWGLEGKAVMQGNPGIDGWGEPDTDKVPDDVIIQTQQQMAVWDMEMVWVPVLWCIGYRPEFRLYHVERDDDMWNGWEEDGKWCDGLCVRAVRWWNKHVVAQVPPGNEPAPLDVIKRIERKQGVFVPADPETHALILAWEESKQSKNEAEKDVESMLREILTRLGDAEGFTLPNGQVFKYAEQNGQRRCDLDALKNEHPDIYERYVTQSKHRTPRVVGKAKSFAA